jgi:hypothetical protein
MERKRDLAWLINWRVLLVCGSTLFAGFFVGMLVFGSPWHLPPAWGDIPTWITAVATLGLLVGAIVTSVYAVRAFGEQTRQLGEQREINREQTKVLGLQAAELRASLAERRSAQASMVFIRTGVGVHPRVDQVQRAVNGPDPEMITAYVENSSDRPIYSPELLWDDGSASLAELAGRSHSERLRAVIMPKGKEDQTKERLPGTTAVMLRFRDAAGNSWLRGPEGDLVYIPRLADSSGQDAALPGIG